MELPRGWDFSRKPHLVPNRQTWPESHQNHTRITALPLLPRGSQSSCQPPRQLSRTSLSLSKCYLCPLIHRGFASRRKGAKDIPRTFQIFTLKVPQGPPCPQGKSLGFSKQRHYQLGGEVGFKDVLPVSKERSTWRAVFTVLAADPPSNNLLTHSPLVLHDQIPNIHLTKGLKLQGP